MPMICLGGAAVQGAVWKGEHGELLRAVSGFLGKDVEKMRKSSRFWWLQGAILLSAAIGCNRNCTNGGGSCGPTANGAPPYGGTVSTSGPISSSGATMYSQSTPYPSGMTMPGGTPSSFSSGASTSYPAPNMASQMPQGLGGTR